MTKPEFIELASKRYDDLQSLNKLDNFYDYEKEFTDIMRSLGKEILEANLGLIPTNPKKKNFTQHLGQRHNK